MKGILVMNNVLINSHPTGDTINIYPSVRRINLRNLENEFYRFLRSDYRSSMFDKDGYNRYQYHIGVGQLQSMDDIFIQTERKYSSLGVDLSDVIDVEVHPSVEEIVDHIKIRVYRDKDEITIGGIQDLLSVSLGYLPADCEITLVEVKFKLPMD
jgi:hypothetical protein